MKTLRIKLNYIQLIFKSIKLYIAIILTCVTASVYGQSLEDNVGEVCMLDSINGPIVLCDMGDLQMNVNEYYSLPDTNIAEPQPNPLCDGGGLNGRPDNIVWYAFQAESTDIELSILAGSCPGGGGIQAGIYSDCTFTETVACSGSNETSINLTNDIPLVIGQTYYLFIDGFMGAECSYHIDLLSSYNDYQLEEISTISSPGIEKNDVICQGMEALFEVTGHNGVNYFWQIEDIDQGIIFTSDTTDAYIHYKFDQTGSYVVRVQGYDSCDTTDEKLFPLRVQILEQEDFGTIEVCGECFGSGMNLANLDMDCVISGNLAGQDPNGDGVMGWLANTNVTTGDRLYIDTVFTPSGCFYEQRVYIDDVGISPRTMIDTFLCSSDFPVQFNGESVNENDIIRTSDPQGADNGCTAYYQYTFHSLNIEGRFYTDCEAGNVTLFFEVDHENSSVATDQLSYSWTVNGGAPTSGISVTGIDVGDSVNLTLTPDSGTCTFDFSHILTAADLNPDEPAILGDILLCSSQDEFKIFVNEDKEIEYVWELSGDLPFTVNTTTDTITVPNPQADFEYRVKAISCGEESTFSIGQVTFTQAPEADFTVPDIVCVGKDFSLINNSVSAGHTYQWTIDGLTFIEGNATTGSGLYRIDSEGFYTVSLVVDDGTCPSSPMERVIQAIERPAAPVLNCDNSVSNSLTYSWTVESWMTDYTFNYPAEYEGNFTDNEDGSVTFDGLPDGTEINFQVVFGYGADCGDVTSSAACTAQSCPPSAISIINVSPEICFTDDMPIIELKLDGSADGAWDTQYVDSEGVFDPNAFGVGQYDIYYNYDVEDCSYSLRARIEVLPRPAINAFIEYPDCNSDAEVAEVRIFKSSGVGELTYYIDGVQREGPLFMLASGTYDVRAMDSNGCEVIDEVVVEPIERTGVEILGDLEIISYEENVFVADPTAGFIPDTYEWTWNGEPICDNDSLCVPELDGGNGVVELCLTASNVDCSDTTCVDVVVRTPVVFGLPNALAPYSQSGNNQFRVSSLHGDVHINHFIVYDRYGNVLHRLQDFTVGKEMTSLWDGRYKGEVLNPGVYVYMLQYTEGDGEVMNISGDLTIIH